MGLTFGAYSSSLLHQRAERSDTSPWSDHNEGRCASRKSKDAGGVEANGEAVACEAQVSSHPRRLGMKEDVPGESEAI
jgi:hypothetical protein